MPRKPRPTASQRRYSARWNREAALFAASWKAGSLPGRGPGCAACRRPFRHGDRHEVDHILEARDRPELFWEPGNWQLLCTSCHRRKTHRVKAERVRGYSGAVGADGFPIDPRHPWRRPEGSG